MKSNWFVMVDAGGNIYEHTFHKFRGGSIRSMAFAELGVNLAAPNILEEAERSILERGDREIACEIETQEIVKITLK